MMKYNVKEQRPCKYKENCGIEDCNGRSQKKGIYRSCYNPLPKILRGNLEKGLLKKL